METQNISSFIDGINFVTSKTQNSHPNANRHEKAEFTPVIQPYNYYQS